MRGFRFARHGALLALLIGGTGCGDVERRGAPDVQGELDAGRDHASILLVEGRSTGFISRDDAVGIGYLERLRLGLGSPFRLVDHALQDPRLSDQARSSVARALLSRTLARESYRVDPRALDRIRVAGQHPGARAGNGHLQLIEGVVREARDPRSGELAVRLAFTLAAAEGTIERSSVRHAVNAAALVRDRELARRDVIRLFQAAARSGAEPLELVGRWRAERLFMVEKPPMEALSPSAEREAMELAPIIAASIRSFGPRLVDDSTGYPVPSSALPLLGIPAAFRLTALADSLDFPDQTPLVVAVDIHRPDLVEPAFLGEREREAAERFVSRARNEERFAAELALLQRHGRRSDPGPALAALWAAVAMRPYSQEEVWFPGFDGPSARELQERYGLAAVDFDDAVPAAWRPYYRRMLALTLQDLQRVMPALDLRGLRVRFGVRPGQIRTLAVHDPRTRTMFLPAGTGAGTIAHEIAHDIDWQISVKRYRVRGDYGTDYAVRRRNDRLATSLQGLTTATLTPPRGDGSPIEHASRPAEIFARSIDWFVAVSLAREGRMNGYLSSVQDDLLTGFGTVVPPDISGSAGAALVSILDEVAPVYASTRDWFLDTYGPGRVLTPYDLLRRVLEPTLQPAGSYGSPEATDQGFPVDPLPNALQRFSVVTEDRDAALGAIDVWVCRAPSAAYDRRLEEARRALVASAAGARARGIALERARALGGQPGRRWMLRQMYGAPWPAAELQPEKEEALRTLLQRVAEIERTGVRDAEARLGFDLVVPRPDCGPRPLVIAS